MTRTLVSIRPGQPEDVPALVAFILTTIRTSNAKDYTLDELKRALDKIEPGYVLRAIKERTYLVAEQDGVLVGTISYTPGRLRTLMVAPEFQGHGIGAALASAVETHLRDQGDAVLEVSSSITAEGFYRKRRYLFVREEYEGTERCPIYHLRF